MLPHILVWALVTSSIGFLLNMLENKSKGLAKFLVGLLGSGWAIATFFAVPVLVSEKVGPVSAVKRSLSIMRKTWGETLIANIGLSALYFVVVFGAILFVMAGGFLFETAPATSFTIWAFCAIWIIVFALIFSTLNTILKAALYAYATHGTVFSAFDKEMMESAFIRK